MRLWLYQLKGRRAIWFGPADSKPATCGFKSHLPCQLTPLTHSKEQSLKKFFLALSLLAVSMLTPAAVSAQTTVTKAPTKSSSKAFTATVRPMATTGGTSGINATIDFSWGYTPNAPPCVANSALVDCYTGFTLTDTTTNTVIATPAVIIPGTLAYAYTPSGGLYFGTHTFSIVANGYDLNGNPLTSPAATASVTNGITSLNGPTGLTGTVTQ